MKEKKEKKIKFNLIDLVVLVVIVAVIAFVGIKFFGAEVKNNATDGNTYAMTFFFEEVPDFAGNAISYGTDVSDEAKNVYLGQIKSVQVGPSRVYDVDANGISVMSAKEGYVSVELTAEVKGSEFEHGIVIGGVKYVVGHTMTVYAGKAKLYGRISDIKKV